MVTAGWVPPSGLSDTGKREVEMADDELVAMIEYSVTAWNKPRASRFSSMRDTDLSGANFMKAPGARSKPE
jgi:hypothetical protein